MTDSVCKQTDKHIDTVTSIGSAAVSSIKDLKNQAAEAGNKAIKQMASDKKTRWLPWTASKIGGFFKYFGGSSKSKQSRRPDLVLFRNILLFMAALVIVYYVLPMVSGSAKTSFSKAQFDKAVKLPESSYNLEDVAKVNQEIRAFEDHKKFFDDGGAFAVENAGTHEIGKSSVALPMMVFFLQFVLPPLALGYIIWFVLTYWKPVIAAMWGWFLAMYNYFTTLIQGRLGCKWYIRWVTGWKCRSPNFYQYFETWRRRYVDGPVYQEKIKYINQYYAAKDRYITKPYKKYIGDPIDQYKVRAEYAQKIATDRTAEVILKKARDARGPFGSKSLFGRLYAGLFGLKQTQDELLNGYDSQTVMGNDCKCPGVNQQTKSLLGKGANLVNNLRRDMPDIGGLGHGRRACELADQTINDRASIMGNLLVLLVAILIAIYMYSWTYGTPVFVKNLLSHTTSWSFSKMQSKKWPYAPYIIIATTIAILAHTGFAGH